MLLVYAAHWPTKCNVGLMSQAVTQPKSGSGHRCQVIAWTRQQGLVLYIGDKGVNVTACLPGGGPAEARDLSALNLPLISIPHPAWMPDDQAKAGEVLNIKLQNMTDLPMFNTIYMREESINYECKHTFNSQIIFFNEKNGLRDHDY